MIPMVRWNRIVERAPSPAMQLTLQRKSNRLLDGFTHCQLGRKWVPAFFSLAKFSAKWGLGFRVIAS
jgi:hypothetical protein